MKEIFYDWGGANVWLFHLINDIRFAWLDQLMLLGTVLGDHTRFPLYLVLLTLIALFSLGRRVQNAEQYQVSVKRWSAVIAVFSLAYWLDGLVLGFLKPYLDFPRPPLALLPDTLHIVGNAEYHHSLPSGHSTFVMMVVASVWPVLGRRWRVAGVCFVLWVGLSRVSLGMHFPADVLAGFLLSLFVVLLAYLAVQRLQMLRINFGRNTENGK
jgi:membrane-associated phospholipid phosphatase